MINENENLMLRKPLRQLVLLGSHVPRQCGIATFTADLARALSEADPSLKIDAIALSDKPGYSYPESVVYEIDERSANSYGPAAEYINRSGYDVLSVQHEYGIFGGDSGCYLMSLVREAKMPIVTTLHTVLRDPNDTQRAVMDELLQLSERVVVMTRRAIDLLVEVHGISPEKVDLIPHGIPEIPLSAGTDLRHREGIRGPMILTFGLLSPDKGIQHVIEAMPAIVQKLPNAVYYVVGATHPNVKSQTGEAYRESLIQRSRELGVDKNVRFVDRFVSKEELVEFLGAMDIYITPYLNPKQITSGTLAYSVGAGKAVISTPYTYAQELLADGRGLLVPFKDPGAIADAVMRIEEEPELRRQIGRRAAAYGRQMLWPEVAKSYLRTFTQARRDSANRFRELVNKPSHESYSPPTLPELRLDHLLAMSDDTGLLQHATYSVPNRNEGYCVDDNARGLILTLQLESSGRLDPEVSALQSRYLSFLHHAYNPSAGRFRNFMGFGRRWLEDVGSEDSQGRAVWALGTAVNRCRDQERSALARSLFEMFTPMLYEMTAPRTWATTILGCDEYLQAFPRAQSVRDLLHTLAVRLWHHFKQNRSPGWPWFEPKMTYANAQIPHAMFVAAMVMGNREMRESALDTLAWLMELQTSSNGCFAPIGSNGFYPKDGERAFFDQQPIEAAVSVSACLAAYKMTRNALWYQEAHRVFNWFLGENMTGQSLFCKTTGGCYDGLAERGVNRNQGAESTLAFLSSLVELRDASMRNTTARLKSDAHDLF